MHSQLGHQFSVKSNQNQTRVLNILFLFSRSLHSIVCTLKYWWVQFCFACLCNFINCLFTSGITLGNKTLVRKVRPKRWPRCQPHIPGLSYRGVQWCTATASRGLTLHLERTPTNSPSPEPPQQLLVCRMPAK